MISEFTVKNFMSIRSEQKLSFIASKDVKMEHLYVRRMDDGTRLLKLAVIYGNNTTGKSNITKALESFRDIMTIKPVDSKVAINVKPFLFDPVYKHTPTIMSMTFYIKGIRHKLSIQFDKDVIYEETLHVYTSSRPTRLYHRKYKSNQVQPKVDFSDKIGLTQKTRSNLESDVPDNGSVLAIFGNGKYGSCALSDVFSYFQNGFLTRSTSVKTMTEFARNFLNTVNDERIKPFLLHSMRQAGFELDDIIVRKKDGKKEISFLHHVDGDEVVIGEEDIAKGALRYLGMSSLTLQQVLTPCISMIDTIDKELVPELRENFLKVFLFNCLNTSQLLLTTHSFKLLICNIIRRDAIWVTNSSLRKGVDLARVIDIGLRKEKSWRNAHSEGGISKKLKLGNPKFDLKELGIYRSNSKP